MNIYSKVFLFTRKYSKTIRKLVPTAVRIWIKEKIVAKNMTSFLLRREEYSLGNYPAGINLLGSIRAEMGLGQSTRLVAHHLELSDYNFSVYNIDFSENLREADHSYDASISEQLPYCINLFHVNPCELGKVFMKMPEAWNRRYNIAFWLWELEEFPDEWVKYCQLFDEIWTPSEFAGRGVAQKTKVPVKIMPYTVTAEVDEICNRVSFGLPKDKFLYLIMYDVNSTTGRKNPQGAIEAYKLAFPVENKDCGLVIKINNAGDKDVKLLKKELEGYENVYFVTDILKKTQVNRLIQCADVYLSLHRSEGFGLVLAEAMLLGTPVVATNWSSNTEFMDERSACMIKYQLVKNKKREGLYKKDCIWAEPDLQDAAKAILRLKEEPTFYRQIAERGKAGIHDKLNQDRLTKLWNKELSRVIKTVDQRKKWRQKDEKNKGNI